MPPGKERKEGRKEGGDKGRKKGRPDWVTRYAAVTNRGASVFFPP